MEKIEHIKYGEIASSGTFNKVIDAANVSIDNNEKMSEALPKVEQAAKEALDAAKVANAQVEVVQQLKTDVETYIGAGKETVVVSITSSVEGVSVEDLDISVFINNAENPLIYTTDENGMVTFRVDVGNQYRVSFPYIPGCAIIGDVKHTAGVAQRSIEVEYAERSFNTEKFSLQVLKITEIQAEKYSNCNVYVTVDGVRTAYQCDDEGQFFIEIPIGKEYTVALDKEEDYYLYGNKYIFTFVAENARRDMTATYNNYNTGVFIVANDLATYTLQEWIDSGRPNDEAVLLKFTNKTLIEGGNTFGVNIDTLSNNEHTLPSKPWAYANVVFESIINGMDYRGLDNTVKIINEGDEKGLNTPAAIYCFENVIELSNVRIQGFLPAVNQYVEFVSNRRTVQYILSIIRPNASRTVDEFITKQKWTSNQIDTGAYYYANSENEGATGMAVYRKIANKSVEPFYAI